MSRILPATCNASGAVTVDEVVVEGALVLSEGTKASMGVLLLDQEQATYLPSSAADIKQVIIDLVAIIEKIILIETGLDSATGNTQAANIAALTTLKTSFNLTKDTLK